MPAGGARTKLSRLCKSITLFGLCKRIRLSRLCKSMCRLPVDALTHCRGREVLVGMAAQLGEEAGARLEGSVASDPQRMRVSALLCPPPKRQS